jgi:hypothetical protein
MTTCVAAACVSAVLVLLKFDVAHLGIRLTRRFSPKQAIQCPAVCDFALRGFVFLHETSPLAG